MATLQILFWTLLLLLVHGYGGYLLWILPFVKRRTHSAEHELPACSLIIAAYDEEDVIEDKIRNTLQLDYPSDRLEILVVTDGSTDQTATIAGRFSGVKVFHSPERKGKLAAIQRIIPFTTGQILVFSDANCLLNPEALLKLVRHYSDPATGAVSGEKNVMITEDGAAATEGLYWKYESFLKKCDAGFYSVVGAAGELYSVRKSLYFHLPEDTILDDFTSSLLVCAQGYRVDYEPEAIALEPPSPAIKAELERKIRIAAGGFQAMARISGRIFHQKNFRLSYLYLSHRVLRWLIAPPALLLVLIINILIVWLDGPYYYNYFLWCQVIFYLLAIAGAALSTFQVKLGPLKFPFYFCFMNLAVAAGFVRKYGKGQQPTWEKIPRKKWLNIKRPTGAG